MADLKISQLPLAGPLNGSEAWPAVQSGITVQTKGSDLAAYLSTQFLPAGIVNATELGYVAGVTGPIQNQLNTLKDKLYWKDACRVSTTEETELNGLHPVDDVMLVKDDRVLVQFQSDPRKNGIYLAQPGEWARARDFMDDGNHLAGAVISVREGHVYKNKAFICSSNEAVMAAGGPITFVLFGGKEYTGFPGQITVTSDDENNNMIGIDPDILVSFMPASATLASVLANGSSTGANDLFLEQQPAGRVTILDSSHRLVSSPVYSTELEYLSGVTSPVQSQFNTLKANSYWKDSCLVSTTEEITLASMQVIDGVFVEPDQRVLVQFQGDRTQNGIYIAQTEDWIRASDFNENLQSLGGAVVTIRQGNTYKDKAFICTNDEPVSIGEHDIEFTPFGGQEYNGTDGQISIDANNNIGLLANLSTVLANGNVTGTGGIVFDNQTANTVPYLNGSKKITSSAVTPTELGYMSGVTSPVQPQLNGLSGAVGTLSDTISSLGAAKYWKDACLVSTTQDIDLTGHQNIDGVDVTDDMRVLVQFQESPEQNGIYISSDGDWTRAADFDDNADHLAAAVVAIQEGATYKNKLFICSNTGAVSFDDGNPVTFGPFGGSSYTGVTGEITVSGNVIGISPSYEPVLSNCEIAVGNGSNRLSSSANLYYNGTELYVNGNLVAQSLANSSGYILQANSDGLLTGSTNLTLNGSDFYVNAEVKIESLTGADERLVTADPSGKLAASHPVIEQWISDPETISVLEDDSIFLPGYSGEPVPNTYQSQMYFNDNYFYVCTSDGNWIRMQRV